MRLVASWSGGKDSCLALYKARQRGEEVCLLLNFISAEYQRCCFHGLPRELITLQARALGLPLLQVAVPADMQEYEKKFKLTVKALKEKEKIQGMIFGDIYLEEHKSWVDRVSQELEIIPVQPLWAIPAGRVVEEFLEAGFHAIIVSAKADLFGPEFLGREVDEELINDLGKKKICLCGENGEFHTFVYDGPLFQAKINIKETEKMLKEGFWSHWFLDIKSYAWEAK